MSRIENLNPALPKLQTSPILNDVMFQSMLSSWLEDKGFIADIQSQIRFKLVNVLRNTAVGRNLCRKYTQRNSLLKQALNMIVAEYLLANDYEYSLSVFSTESGLVNLMPNNFLQNSSEERVYKKFDFDDILHIFELLGFSEKSMIGTEILNSYQQETQSNSVLCCLINILSKQIKNKSKVSPEVTEVVHHFDITNESNLVKQIVIFLKKTNISIDEMKYLIDNIKKIHFCEIQNIEANYFEEISKFKRELETKEKIIEDISKKNKKIELSLVKLARDYTSLRHQKREGEHLNDKENLKTKDNIKNQLREDQKEVGCVLTHCGTICKLNADALEEMKKENGSLKTEIFELKNTNNAQHKEIMMLSMRYNDLINAFMDCQSKLLLLTSKESVISNQVSFQQSKNERFISREKKVSNLFNEEVSSESITEEIVKEARQRLRILDNESNAIEAMLSSISMK